ncbi:unnamed protein product [Clonostachys rosea]|uniref:Rhodopsin domain-containing protein n=1 Tax=Bionectria ochroleuca TaxID=29856 RepID=A0ABY6UTT8_BIOOC|nr:unnamed protein product [Clonostachys rosea]
MENPGFDLYETNGTRLLITISVFLALSWVAVAFRTYTTAYLIRAFRTDDWLMLIAQVSATEMSYDLLMTRILSQLTAYKTTFTVYSGFLYAGIEAGIGRHNAAIRDDDREVAALKWQALAISMYIVLMLLIKLSIGFLLLRITSHMPVYARVNWASLALISISSVVVFFWNTFQCIPVQKQWDYRITYGQCVRPDEIVIVAYVVSAMTIVTDFFYALIPIPMVWSVKMTIQAKTTVVLILGMGIFASVATIVRIRFLTTMANLDDVLYAGTDAMIWTIAEAGLAIIAASLATIRPLLHALRIRGFESSDSCENIDASDLQVLQPRPSRQRRFFQFYGIDDMPLTHDTRPETIFCFHDDTKPQNVGLKDTGCENHFPQRASSKYWEDTEGGLHAVHTGTEPPAGWNGRFMQP